MTRDQAIEKVRKCLALAKSSNANEAATALRQALKLMEKFGIDQDAVELSEVKAARGTAGAQSVSIWIGNLAHVVADAFGCKHYFNQTLGGTFHVEFLGLGVKPKVATYAFAVLRTQLTADRKRFYKTTRGKRINRIGRADQFALAWIFEIEQHVKQFASEVPGVVCRAFDLVKTEKGLETSEARLHGSKDPDLRALLSGRAAGRNAQLHHGVNADERGLIGLERQC